ncbi:hypothetical protein DIRU0_E26852 [Diutina rugosa]
MDRLRRYRDADTSVDFADAFDLDEVQLSVSRLRTHKACGIVLGGDSSSPFVESLQDLQRPRPRHHHPAAESNDAYRPMSPIVEQWSDSDDDKENEVPPGASQLPETPKRRRPSPAKASQRTPHRRQTSVAVSLTPAQRFEKHPGKLRSHNALENFEFIEMVGRGAFASVYRGRNRATGQIVAIKQIALDDDATNVGNLMGEIDLLKILKHPNIVKYHGFVKTSSSLNIFLEYCGGGSLRQLYKRHQHGLDERRQIVPYVRSILHGLAYLHSQGVVHRDVKAANVLIDDAGNIKLADFGVAASVSTQYPTVVGTPNWMAPETVMGGEGLCTASDIWSLGATIIELFTTDPPYHDRNPMATLHAISTDDHPPLPKGVSTLARDFLLECFQKHPNLRSSATQLLKHPWLADGVAVTSTARPVASETQGYRKLAQARPLPQYSEANEDNWDGDFDLPGDNLNPQLAGATMLKPPPSRPPQLQLPPPSDPPTPKEKNAFKFGREIVRLRPVGGPAAPPASAPSLPAPSSAPAPVITVDASTPQRPTDVPKQTLLERFSEDNEFHTTRILSGVDVDRTLPPPLATPAPPSADDDPFSKLEIEVYDSKELEVQMKMEFLLTKFTKRVAALKYAEDDSQWASLVKITSRMSHIVRKYPASHPTFVREHGFLSLLELLELAPELPKQGKVWYHVVVIVNHLLAAALPSTELLENFCLLGGIPMVFQLRQPSYDPPVRTQVVKFLRLFVVGPSDKALSMLVSSGGLRVVSKFVEDDFDLYPLHPLVSVECLHSIFVSNLVPSKSDFCRVLSKYGVVFWMAVLLHRLTRPGFTIPPGHGITDADVNAAITHAMEVFSFFSVSEPRVRINIAHTDLFKILIKTFHHVDITRRLNILKFFKQMSCIGDILPRLYKAEIIEFLYRLLETTTATTSSDFDKIINSVAPILYNCCYLNHRRETELVALGAVPYLKELALSKLHSRQFILPIFCELVHCDDSVRDELRQHNALPVYWQLVLDPYWQSNALDSLLHWSQGKDGSIAVESSQAVDCLRRGFLLPKVANIEATVDAFYRLFAAHPKLVAALYDPGIINSILHKMHEHQANVVVQVSLLRILKIFVAHGAAGAGGLGDVGDRIRHTLSKQAASSLLVRELTGEVTALIIQ